MATEQGASRNLEFWAGEFGSEYARRNQRDPALVAAVARLWSAALARVPVGDIKRVLEVGANVGITQLALQRVLDAETWAVEPNPEARHALVTERVVPAERVSDGDIVDLKFEDRAFDLSLTSGVLIHVHPDDLERACRKLARVSGRWVAILEYFANQPEDVPYRGHEGRLFKRDFGEFFLDTNPDFECIDYGFAWRRHTGMDNSTWFLFRRR
jgi:pseudaminic acid biosynthesis-associated methylase